MPSDLSARDRAVVWHPAGPREDYDAHPALPVVGAAGSWIHLADGRRLLDGTSSWWCRSLGHGHPRVTAALAEQGARCAHVIGAWLTHEPAVRLAERLVAIGNGAPPAAWGPGAPPGRVPGHFGSAIFVDNGSTAVEVAVKLALQGQAQAGRTGRTRLAALADAYHGETAGAMSLSDLGAYRRHAEPLLTPCLRLGPLPHRSGPEDPRWMDAGEAWPAIQAQLDAGAASLAAVVVEPVLQGAAGMRLFSPDLLRRLRGWCDAHDVWLIADEIAAGMGRLGPMLACQLAGVRPDLAVLSKGLTGGTLPFAAVLVPDRHAELFDGPWSAGRFFPHSNTFSVHALGCAVANAVLDVYAEQDLPERAARLGAGLRLGLAAALAHRPWAGPVRGCGMVAAVDLRRADGGALAGADRTGYRVARAAIDRGALLRPLGDTLYLMPPLTASADEITALIGILAEAGASVLGG
jgi:adenosylmethionine---8-amino-7-oxononanoate aminotransferase